VAQSGVAVGLLATPKKILICSLIVAGIVPVILSALHFPFDNVTLMNEDRFFGVERAVTPAQHQKNEFIIECDIIKYSGIVGNIPNFDHLPGP
jgi:hypothetical protein